MVFKTRENGMSRARRPGRGAAGSPGRADSSSSWFPPRCRHWQTPSRGRSGPPMLDATASSRRLGEERPRGLRTTVPDAPGLAGGRLRRGGGPPESDTGELRSEDGPAPGARPRCGNVVVLRGRRAPRHLTDPGRGPGAVKKRRGTRRPPSVVEHGAVKPVRWRGPRASDRAPPYRTGRRGGGAALRTTATEGARSGSAALRLRADHVPRRVRTARAPQLRLRRPDGTASARGSIAPRRPGGGRRTPTRDEFSTSLAEDRTAPCGRRPGGPWPSRMPPPPAPGP